MRVTMSEYADILPILQTMATVICLGGASLLFLRGRGNRSRRMLAVVMSIWGLIYTVRVAGTLMGNPDLNFTSTGAADTLVLIVGNFFLIVLLLYPLEVVRPGWLSLKRAGILLFPYAALSLLYYAGLYLLGQEPLLLRDTDQFMEHIGEFNVWYRLLMIASIVLYLAFLFRLTWRYKEVYRQWCHDNYSDQKNIDISWLRRYGIGVALIGVAYFWLLFDGSTYCLIVHNLTVQCFFCYTLYKGLFQDNPYTEDFFRHTLDETDARREAELREERLSANHADSPGDESIFLRKLPAYRDEVARWMAERKPYLRGDFKLMDVSEILPLNRTYLSRVFNDGFGDSFSSVVRGYRMREAEEMLVSHRDIPVGQVGELCGFSSPSVFHRAFVESHGGLTPNRYRRQSTQE